ncbi:MAG: ferritin-like domain-containing protein, partial [Pseudomonadales bacterium]
MSDFLSAFSIQSWLESCPQGYLDSTEYGHQPGEKESEAMLDNEDFLEQEIRTTVQLVLGERAALAASSGLINLAPDDPSRMFLATQTLDEARHVEIFTQRLYDLGVKKSDLDGTLANYGNPNLVKFAEVLLEKIDKGDFVAGVVGQNIVLEGMAFSVFEMMHATNEIANPKFAHTLSGTIADERRHVGFGENRIGSLLQAQPEKKPEIQKMQQEMTAHMLAVFSDSFSESEEVMQEVQASADPDAGPAMYQGVDLNTADSEEMEAVLSNTVIGEFKTRLARIGLDYQTPDR